MIQGTTAVGFHRPSRSVERLRHPPPSHVPPLGIRSPAPQTHLAASASATSRHSSRTRQPSEQSPDGFVVIPGAPDVVGRPHGPTRCPLVPLRAAQEVLEGKRLSSGASGAVISQPTSASFTVARVRVGCIGRDGSASLRRYNWERTYVSHGHRCSGPSSTSRGAARRIGFEPGNIITAFSPQPGRCFRMVYSVQLQADHCRQPPAWKGQWRDVKGHWWSSERVDTTLRR